MPSFTVTAGDTLDPTARTIAVSLTEQQIKTLRMVISEKALFVKSHPLPEDGNLFDLLCDAAKPLHLASEYF